MPQNSSTSPGVRSRYRLRFRKQGDLRLIGHHDLLRVFERLFRRTGLQLGLSAGFHPKARMSFPGALSLGVAGEDEVMEFELAETCAAGDLAARLRPQLPPGLELKSLEWLAPGERKAPVVGVEYTAPVADSQRDVVQAGMARLLAAEHWPVQREGQREAIDLRGGIEQLQLESGLLRMRLTVGQANSPRPREVLAAVGLADLELSGAFLTRTRVALAPRLPDDQRDKRPQAVPRSPGASVEDTTPTQYG